MRAALRPALLGAVAVLVVAGATAALLMDHPGVPLVVIVVLAGIAAAAGVETRLRTAGLGHGQRLAARRQAFVTAQVHAVLTELKAQEGPEAVLARLEVAERRVLGDLAVERTRNGDRHDEVLAAVDRAGASVREDLSTGVHRLGEQVDAAAKGVRTEVARSGRARADEIMIAMQEETRETEALLQLHGLTEPRPLMPPSGRWAMNARSLVHLLDIVAREEPHVVVELGGGTSTVWSGLLLRQWGGRLVSIEHDEVFAAVTRRYVEHHGLADVVEVRVAPLVPVPGREAPWYDPEVLRDIERIDLLVVDGPPGRLGEEVRAPALDVLGSRLSPGALVVLDDSGRPGERRVLAEWVARDPALHLEDEGVSRLAVLRRGVAGEPAAG